MNIEILAQSTQEELKSLFVERKELLDDYSLKGKNARELRLIKVDSDIASITQGCYERGVEYQAMVEKSKNDQS